MHFKARSHFKPGGRHRDVLCARARMKLSMSLSITSCSGLGFGVQGLGMFHFDRVELNMFRG